MTNATPSSVSRGTSQPSRFRKSRSGAAFTASKRSMCFAAASTCSCRACPRWIGWPAWMREQVGHLRMSDHISGPRAVADPVIDITDVFAFPSPDSPRHLVLIMNVFPYAGLSAVFSDAVIYRLRVRSVSLASDRRAFAVGADEFIFDCTFD